MICYLWLPIRTNSFAEKAFTSAAVTRIKPPRTGQIDHFDAGYPGLALRVSYGGTRTWVWFYRQHGKLRRLTLGALPKLGLADAREAWRVAHPGIICGYFNGLVRRCAGTGLL